MNHLRRYISPGLENKDSSLKVAAVLTLIALVILATLVSEKHPAQEVSIEQLTTVTESQKATFIDKVRQRVAKANRKIKYQQALLEKLNQRLASQSFHSNSDLKKLRRLYQEYGLDTKITASDYDSSVGQLQQRMLTVDPSIVIAMAALESNWGRSKRALQTNNYFIKTCSKLACDSASSVSRKNISQSATSKKPNIYRDHTESVKALINLINSHDNFQVFRNTRAGFQRRGKLYSGEQIIGTLKYAAIYSEVELKMLENLLLENSR